MDDYTFSFPIWVEFGTGASGKVGEIADTQGWGRAFIVTDPGIVEAGLTDGIVDALETEGVEHDIYDGVRPNPTVSMVEETADAIEASGADFVVAVGGGSTMDVAKTASMLVTNGGTVADYEVVTDEDVIAEPVENHPVPLVTVPTTAGTGSEVDFWAVITDTEREFKMALGQPPLYPGGPYLGASVSLVDPALTASLPPRQTAATGFDALSHALENYVSAVSPPLVKPLAVHVMELVAEYLPEAYHEGTMEAREKVMFAAHLAGMGENLAGFGAIHSLAEVTGAMYPDIPHGEVIAIFTPAVMEFNREAVPERYRDIAAALGEDVEGLSVDEASRRAVTAVEDLMEELDLPSRLRDVGVAEDDLQTIAEKSMATSEIGDNPREADADDLLGIARNSY
ncbi:MAG: iron-containing alcohol dehydrogenase [Halobacteriales archaeon SW_9_67_25]|jgi:alcohol dehydrogenase class IV|nr:MAG: iron-containing alcohol dehydrogenase [Halobacteriales archaeon SW_9_67_25]